MRLLRCASVDSNESIRVSLEEPSSIPPYAILSHRWTDGEVSFADMNSGLAESKKGYMKLRNCCWHALRDGYRYIWIDTCCIDKSSSAELSEAINSMYAWYKNAKVCYAYLHDVASEEDPRVTGSSFRCSEWFTRGWTLQELIAPSSVVFCASDWTEIGSKASLADVVEEITLVEEAVLVQTKKYDVSVAKRMSWAANRKTTRVEDRAYSLMGLLGVNMPTLYGEGYRAFIRLQEEILRVSSDHSIFAWEGEVSEAGLLATSPDQFLHSIHFSPIHRRAYEKRYGVTNLKADYAMTNLGLRIQLPLLLLKPKDAGGKKGLYRAFLACDYDGGVKRDWMYGEVVGERESTWIYLQRNESEPGHHFTRTSLHKRSLGYGPTPEYSSDTRTTVAQDIYVARDNPSLFNTLQERGGLRCKFVLKISGCGDLQGVDYFPLEFWSLSDELSLTLSDSGNSFGAVLFPSTVSGESFAAVLGVYYGRAWSNVEVSTQRSAEAIYKRYIYVKSELKGHDWVKNPLGTGDGRNVHLTVREVDTNDEEKKFAVNIAVK